ncbi:hypothetical protein D9M72_608120 [compost metagenome]
MARLDLAAKHACLDIGDAVDAEGLPDLSAGKIRRDQNAGIQPLVAIDDVVAAHALDDVAAATAEQDVGGIARVHDNGFGLAGDSDGGARQVVG